LQRTVSCVEWQSRLHFEDYDEEGHTPARLDRNSDGSV
jgi:hypothetical protein